MELKDLSIKERSKELIKEYTLNPTLENSDKVINSYNKNPIMCPKCQKEYLTFNDVMYENEYCWKCYRDMFNFNFVKEMTIEEEMEKLNQEIIEEKRNRQKQDARFNKKLIDIQSRCKHDWEMYPDASGNNDDFYECNICKKVE